MILKVTEYILWYMFNHRIEKKNTQYATKMT